MLSPYTNTVVRYVNICSELLKGEAEAKMIVVSHAFRIYCVDMLTAAVFKKTWSLVTIEVMSFTQSLIRIDAPLSRNVKKS